VTLKAPPRRTSRSGATRLASPAMDLPSITAGVCAFSLTSRITQRDGTIGRDAPGSRTLLYPGDPGPHRPAPPRRSRASGRLPEPGLLDDSGLASASRPRIARGPQAPGRQPGHPGTRSSSPAASGRPGRAPVHPLRHDPRSAPPPGGRSPCGRHDGRGRQRTTAIQEDPVGGRCGRCRGMIRHILCRPLACPPGVTDRGPGG
jgi:hypothetical protein